jgi:hypothetical protein
MEDKTYQQALQEALARHEGIYQRSAQALLEQYFCPGWEITTCEETVPEESQGERSIVARVQARAIRDIDGYNSSGAYVKMPCGSQIILSFWLIEHRIYADIWMKPRPSSTAFSLHQNPTVTPGYQQGGWSTLPSRPGASGQGWIVPSGRHIAPRKRSARRQAVYQRRATG